MSAASSARARAQMACRAPSRSRSAVTSATVRMSVSISCERRLSLLDLVVQVHGQCHGLGPLGTAQAGERAGSAAQSSLSDAPRETSSSRLRSTPETRRVMGGIVSLPPRPGFPSWRLPPLIRTDGGGIRRRHRPSAVIRLAAPAPC